MSWDLTIYKFPKEIETVADLPSDFDPPALADRAQIAQSLKQLFPSADISDPEWLVVDDEGFKIEINTGHKDPCKGLTLHVRGSELAVNAVTKIAKIFQARAFDLTAYQFLDRMKECGRYRSDFGCRL
jgi:hypothetical protein